jgi:hypothetical protein
MLEDEKFEVSYDRPMETRGGGIEPAVHVALTLTEGVGSSLLATGGIALAKKVIQTFKKRHPGVEVDVVDDERQTGSE